MKQEIRKSEQELTKLVKSTIKNLGAYKSGKMYRSTSIKIKLNKTDFDITIDSTEYFSDVDKDYRIVDTFLNDKRVNDIITNLTVLMIEDNI
jgi:hypothetical protein